MRKGIPALLLTLSLLLCGCRLLPERIPPAGLTVHFIDVGQADCALLESGGEYMLIDGGNREDGRLVVSYLEQQGVEELSAVVCTHAHEDHVGGLPSVLAVYPTHAVYAPTRTSGWRSPFPPPATAGRWEKPLSQSSDRCSPTPTPMTPPSF